MSGFLLCMVDRHKVTTCLNYRVCNAPFSLIKQVDKMQAYNDNKKVINVFEKNSVNIVSGISFNS